MNEKMLEFPQTSICSREKEKEIPEKFLGTRQNPRDIF